MGYQRHFRTNESISIKRRRRKNMCSNWICAVMLLLTCLPISKCEDGANTPSEQSEEDMRMLQLVVYIALAVIVICALILCSSVVYVWHLYQKRKKELPLHKSTMDV